MTKCILGKDDLNKKQRLHENKNYLCDPDISKDQDTNTDTLDYNIIPIAANRVNIDPIAKKHQAKRPRQ